MAHTETAADAPAPPASGMPIVTDAAFDRVAAIIADEPAGTMLRVAVDGGGCSGFQYRYELTQEKNEDDLVLERDGVKVLIDEVSLPFLADSAIDYKVTLMGAAFEIENPNATSSCGCGTSFSI